MLPDLLLPPKGKEALILPSYVKLDMAFGMGAGTTLFDKSRYRSHGTISGASWATGAHGYALDFNSATPDYIEILADQTQLNFTAGDFSIIARIYPTNIVATYRRIFNRGVINTDGYGLWIENSTKKPWFTTYQAGANQSSRGETLDVDTWYTIGVSRSGASVIFYQDGVEATTSSGTHINPATCARTAKVGIYDDKVSHPFDGKIEFLRIFGGIALSASEHLAYHNALV